jgi:spermidine synthase
VLPMGADVYSTTIIVGAFMAGLGCGSLAGGRAADRFTRLQCVWLFIGAELAVGAFGFASRTVFYDWLYLRLGPASLHLMLTAASVFATLLWPTFWMGVSLPVLTRAVTEQVSAAAMRVGVLYGLNTLGAAAGAFVTTWVLFPRIGMAGSVRFAAVLNIIAALAALPLLRAPARSRVESRASDAPHARQAAGESEERVESSGWPEATDRNSSRLADPWLPPSAFARSASADRRSLGGGWSGGRSGRGRAAAAGGGAGELQVR